MKSRLFIAVAVLAVPNIAQQPSQTQDSYPRWTKAQKYVAKGFEPVDCFAGQVRVQRKQFSRQPFSVFVPNEQMKCCGRLVKDGQTDHHGHFLVEPMEEGEYFAQFEFKGVHYTTKFAIIESYLRCDGSHIEVNFSEPTNAKIQSYADIDDSGEECRESEPRCYRK